MQLPSAGREYARVSFSEFTSGVSMVATVDDFVTTLAVVVGTDGVGRVLLKGPTYSGDATAALLVPAAGATLKIKATDTPELVIRTVGEVDIV